MASSKQSKIILFVMTINPFQMELHIDTDMYSYGVKTQDCSDYIYDVHFSLIHQNIWKIGQRKGNFLQCLIPCMLEFID